MRRRLVLLLVILFVVAPQALGQGASFDCGKAVTKVEKMICGNAKLSDLDGSLGLLYKKVMEQSPAPEDVKERQRGWIQGWRNTCKDSSCLERAYTVQILELEKDWQNIPFKPSFAKPLLSFPSLPPDDYVWPTLKKEPLELIGRIQFNHDGAGGKYDISSGKTNYTIRYLWDLTDDQKNTLAELQEASQYVVLRSTLVKYKDGTTRIDPHSVVKIFGQSP